MQSERAWTNRLHGCGSDGGPKVLLREPDGGTLGGGGDNGVERSMHCMSETVYSGYANLIISTNK